MKTSYFLLTMVSLTAFGQQVKPTTVQPAGDPIHFTASPDTKFSLDIHAYEGNENAYLIYLHSVTDEKGGDVCRYLVRKDGFVHSEIAGREYVQTCRNNNFGILRPYVKHRTK